MQLKIKSSISLKCCGQLNTSFQIYSGYTLLYINKIKKNNYVKTGSDIIDNMLHNLKAIGHRFRKTTTFNPNFTLANKNITKELLWRTSIMKMKFSKKMFFLENESTVGNNSRQWLNHHIRLTKQPRMSCTGARDRGASVAAIHGQSGSVTPGPARLSQTFVSQLVLKDLSVSAASSLQSFDPILLNARNLHQGVDGKHRNMTARTSARTAANLRFRGTRGRASRQLPTLFKHC